MVNWHEHHLIPKSCWTPVYVNIHKMYTNNRIKHYPYKAKGSKITRTWFLRWNRSTYHNIFSLEVIVVNKHCFEYRFCRSFSNCAFIDLYITFVTKHLSVVICKICICLLMCFKWQSKCDIYVITFVYSFRI
jgi:hypothetical protein